MNISLNQSLRGGPFDLFMGGGGGGGVEDLRKKIPAKPFIQSKKVVQHEWPIKKCMHSSKKFSKGQMAYPSGGVEYAKVLMSKLPET